MIEILVLLALLVFAWLLFGVVAGLVNFIITVLVWIFIGFLAGKLIRGKGYGPIWDAVLGIGGGVVGSILFSVIGAGAVDNNWIGRIVVGTVGAVVLVFLVRLVNKDFAR